MTLYKYKAFISYSHADKLVSKQLLDYLERFRVPKHVSKDYSRLQSARSLGRFFRDREELAASDSLEGEIVSAIEQSEYLIVLCSPLSANSERVAFEINAFLQNNNSSNILCLIVDGLPNFDDTIKNLSESCIPKPLRDLSAVNGKTPLAADMRAEGDGITLAFKKIVAGLLGIEMHTLMQREARRLQKKVLLVTVAGATIAFALIGLVINVQLAKNAEEAAKNLAISQQERAENLIGFMVDDLVVAKLQQLGRVEVIDAVVNELVDHYVQQDDNYLTPDALGRKARVFMELGRVYLRRQDEKQAKSMFDQAYFVTKKILEKHPASTSALYDHVHTLYWLGRYELVLGRFNEAANYWRQRVALFDRLMSRPDLSRRAYFEVGDMHIHLGWALMEQGAYQEAKALFLKGLEVRTQVAAMFKPELAWLNNVAGAYHHLAWADEFLGNANSSIAYSRKSIEIYEKLWLADKTDQRAHTNLARSYRWLSESQYSAGRFLPAKNSVLQSLEHFEPILSFEPTNEDKQLQYCWSAVQLIEIEAKLGEYIPANHVLEKYCPNAKGLINAVHVKAYNRMLGYRAALTEIEHHLKTETQFIEVRKSIKLLTAQLLRETDQALSSAMGKRIKLRHAIVVLRSDENLEYSLMSNIINTLESADNNNDMSHPSTSDLVDTAKKLLSGMIDK